MTCKLAKPWKVSEWIWISSTCIMGGVFFKKRILCTFFSTFAKLINEHSIGYLYTINHSASKTRITPHTHHLRGVCVCVHLLKTKRQRRLRVVPLTRSTSNACKKDFFWYTHQYFHRASQDPTSYAAYRTPRTPSVRRLALESGREVPTCLEPYPPYSFVNLSPDFKFLYCHPRSASGRESLTRKQRQVEGKSEVAKDVAKLQFVSCMDRVLRECEILDLAPC